MYKLKLILRYLRARRITVIPIAAVAAAVFLLVVVLSVMNGFSGFVQEKLRGTTSDVIVEYDHLKGFEHYETLADEISRNVPGVVAVSPHIKGKAVLTVFTSGKTHDVYDFPCEFIGIDLDAEDRVSGLREMLFSPETEPDYHPDDNAPAYQSGRAFDWSGAGKPMPGLIAGRWVLRQKEIVRQGLHVSLTTPVSVDEDSSMTFRLTDYFKTGLWEFDQTTIYIPLAAAQKLTDTEGRVTSLHVRAEDGADLDSVKTGIERILADDARFRDDDRFSVKTWLTSQKVFIDATRMERLIWAVILSAMLAVAGFCILAVMSLTVIQKTRDIGILRSIGASVRGIGATFIQYGLTVGFIGATLGLALGALVLVYLDPIETFVLKHTGWTPWPRSVFYFEEIPRQISALWMFLFWTGGIAVSFLASLIPAVRAARTNPVNTLRYEH